MREIFTMGPVKTSTTKDGDTKITIHLETIVGPGMREPLCTVLEVLAFQQVMAEITLIQTNLITGEVK
jgi:hypothetical protein